MVRRATHLGHGTRLPWSPTPQSDRRRGYAVLESDRRAARSAGEQEIQGDRMQASGVGVSCQQGTGAVCAAEGPLRRDVISRACAMCTPNGGHAASPRRLGEGGSGMQGLSYLSR